MLDWKKLYFGHITRAEILEAIHDAEWQKLRLELKGASLEQKYIKLLAYYKSKEAELTRNYLEGKYIPLPAGAYAHDLRMLEVRITNYVTALARGGLIKREDYK